MEIMRCVKCNFLYMNVFFYEEKDDVWIKSSVIKSCENSVYSILFLLLTFSREHPVQVAKSAIEKDGINEKDNRVAK